MTNTTFKQKVLDIVSKIPKGKVLTYKEVAKKAGSPNASRAVGSILKQNFNPKIPCHRVIKNIKFPKYFLFSALVQK
jgi:O-6-methylguanine DNA methyltransferase